MIVFTSCTLQDVLKTQACYCTHTTTKRVWRSTVAKRGESDGVRCSALLVAYYEFDMFLRRDDINSNLSTYAVRFRPRSCLCSMMYSATLVLYAENQNVFCYILPLIEALSDGVRCELA